MLTAPYPPLPERFGPHPMFNSSVMFAHSVAGRPLTDWEPLRDHLDRVGRLAAELASAFGWHRVAEVAGRLHDLGKASPQFQNYIRAIIAPEGAAEHARGGDHSTAGARLAVERYGPSLGRLLAFGIAGHHAGLGSAEDLDRRIAALPLTSEALASWAEYAGPLPDFGNLKPTLSWQQNPRSGFSAAFLVRMLFSCLVDADSLETERFYAAVEKTDVVRSGYLPIGELQERFRLFQATRQPDSKPINKLRAEVLAHAVSKSPMQTGLFTLTVPTGGGKTLTSLAFSLEHAAQHNLRRIVYVIPYTSIIEQTAESFRTALGTPDCILEHHASFDWEQTGRSISPDDVQGQAGLARLQRAAENWDAPVVVTTAVQFFESLYASRRSPCRKLHNLARSVIVLDEAQTLPLHLLHPCLAALDELQMNYGTTVVLCTATQPAIRIDQDGFKGGLSIPDDRELAPNPPELYSRLQRVQVRRAPVEMSDSDIAKQFVATPQMLCIVNSRAHAADLFGLIKRLDGAVHLSTLMCPLHRRSTIANLRRRLKDKQPVRLISTSLIEAGVDISFPEVWRAVAGLDSIAQAAGRCNREGELSGLGRVVVFTPAARVPPHEVRQLGQHALSVMDRFDDPLALDAMRAYFGDVYWSRSARLDNATIDKRPFPILPEIAAAAPGMGYDFASIARAFRMIDEAMLPVIVPWQSHPDDSDAATLLDRIAESGRPSRADLRRLQQYTVGVPAKARGQWLALDVLRPVHPLLGDALLAFRDDAHYDPSTGVRLSDPTYRSIGSLMAD